MIIERSLARQLYSEIAWQPSTERQRQWHTRILRILHLDLNQLNRHLAYTNNFIATRPNTPRAAAGSQVGRQSKHQQCLVKQRVRQELRIQNIKTSLYPGLNFLQFWYLKTGLQIKIRFVLSFTLFSLDFNYLFLQ